MHVPRPAARFALTPVALVAAVVLLCASLVVEVQGHRASGLSPRASAYGSVVYMVAVLQGVFFGRTAPHRTRHGRLDETRAARRPS